MSLPPGRSCARRPEGGCTGGRRRGRNDAGNQADGAVAIGYAPAVAWSELGFGLPGQRLLVSAEFAAHAFDVLQEIGQSFGLGCAGAYAARSLRIEAGEGAWGIDIDDTVTPAELGIADRLVGNRDFLGRSALEGKAVRKRLVRLALTAADDDHPPFRQEPILADGQVVGMTTCGGFGHRIGRPVALGWLIKPEVLAAKGNRAWEIEVAGKRLAVEIAVPPNISVPPCGTAARSSVAVET